MYLEKESSKLCLIYNKMFSAWFAMDTNVFGFDPAIKVASENMFFLHVH